MKRLAFLLFTSIAFAPSAESQISAGTFRVWAGAGYGSFGCWESFRCDSFVFGEARQVFSGFVGGAKAISRFVEAGAELTTRAKDKGGMTFAQRSVSAVLIVHPPIVSNLGLRGSFGRAFLSQSGQVDDMLISDRRSGRSGTVGISYDLRFMRRLSVTPGFEIGGVDFGSERASKMWEYRLALTWQ